MNKTAIVETQVKEKTADKQTKRVREDKCVRRKDEKSFEHVWRAIDTLGSPEEKLGAMMQKYAEMFNDHRLLQTAIKQSEKKNIVLQKEKEQLQSEHSKAILTRSRLENLCRELQRQNKAVKEECMLKMREEGEKKREVAAKFHSMLSEIGSLLAQNNDKNNKLRDDNLDMSMRLKSVCDQFEKKEQHVENLAKQMQLEMQLADAKLAKAKMEMDIEKETLQKENQQLLIELSDYKRKLCEMKASELALREQITMYSEKYEEFHKALLQSNSAIGDFKSEMERMTKHIRKLEKETAVWKGRYDAAQRTLTDVTQGKLRSDEALGLANRRLAALQGICRGLQDQCRQLRGDIRFDSQSDEDYRKLEAQIKEVDIAAELDSKPCPRRVSTERACEVNPPEKEEQVLSEETKEVEEDQTNVKVETDTLDKDSKEKSIVEGQESDNKETAENSLLVQSTDMSLLESETSTGEVQTITVTEITPQSNGGSVLNKDISLLKSETSTGEVQTLSEFTSQLNSASVLNKDSEPCLRDIQETVQNENNKTLAEPNAIDEKTKNEVTENDKTISHTTPQVPILQDKTNILSIDETKIDKTNIPSIDENPSHVTNSTETYPKNKSDEVIETIITNGESVENTIPLVNGIESNGLSEAKPPKTDSISEQEEKSDECAANKTPSSLDEGNQMKNKRKRKSYKK